MSSSTKDQLSQAHELLRASHYDDALALLMPICKAEPDNINAWWLLANALQDPEKVKLALNKVLAISPNHAMAKARLNELNAPIKTANRPLPMGKRPIRRKSPPKPKKGYLERQLDRSIEKAVSGLILMVILIGVGVFFSKYNHLLPLNLDEMPTQVPRPAAMNTVAENHQAALIAAPSASPIRVSTSIQASALPATWTPSPAPSQDIRPTFTPWWDNSPTPFTNSITNSDLEGETAQVVQVIDGDTIDVRLNNETVRVRYVGVNTPERNEPCYNSATNANTALVQGQTVRMVRDTSDTDQYGRLLRYIYVGNTFVNQELVRQGMAEAVYYSPDGLLFSDFSYLEAEAASTGIGCHPTGIFDDGSDTR